MSAAIKFWLAKVLVDIGIFFGLVLLVVLWFGFLYGLQRFSEWRFNRVHGKRERPGR